MSEIVKETRFLAFHHEGPSESGKTNRYTVRNKRGGETLALVAWYGPWRCYTADFSDMATFNAECLSDIAAFLRGLTAAQVDHAATLRSLPGERAS